MVVKPVLGRVGGTRTQLNTFPTPFQNEEYVNSEACTVDRALETAAPNAPPEKPPPNNDDPNATETGSGEGGGVNRRAGGVAGRGGLGGRGGRSADKSERWSGNRTYSIALS